MKEHFWLISEDWVKVIVLVLTIIVSRLDSKREHRKTFAAIETIRVQTNGASIYQKVNEE